MTTSRIAGLSPEIRVTPTIDTNAYASGDQLGGVMTLSTGLEERSDWAAYVIQDIVVVDASKQNAQIELMFWKVSPTLQSNNAAADFTLSELQNNFLGSVTIGSSYNSYTSYSSSTSRNVGLQLKPSSSQGGSTNTPKAVIYMSAVVRGTPTYTSTTALTFKIGLAGDFLY